MKLLGDDITVTEVYDFHTIDSIGKKTRNIKEIKKRLKRNELLQLKFETVEYCNLSCDYCRTNAIIEKNSQGDNISQLSPKEFNNLLNQAVKLGLKVLSFEGKGEPVLDKYFVQYLNIALSKELIIKIHTNLYFIHEYVKHNKYSKIIRLLESNSNRISVITTIVNKNELNKGYKSEAIKILKGWGYTNNDTTSLGARILIFQDNKKEIPAIYKQCLDDNIYPKVQSFYPLGRANQLKLLESKEFKALNQDLLEIANEKFKNNFNISHFPGYGTSSLYYTATVNYSGDVKLYPEITEDDKLTFGNIKKDSLKNIWLKDQWQSIRNMDLFIEGKCAGCENLQKGCYGDRVLSYLKSGNKNIFAEDPFCWYEKESKNPKLTDQIVSNIQSEFLKEKKYENTLVIGVINYWEKYKGNVKNAKRDYNLIYSFPSQLEKAALKRKDLIFFTDYLFLKYIYSFGKSKTFANKIMKIGKGVIQKNWFLMKGVEESEKRLFGMLPVNGNENIEVRKSMSISLLQLKDDKNPFGMFFITLPSQTKTKLEGVQKRLEGDLKEYNHAIYEALLRDYYNSVFNNIYSNLNNYKTKKEISVEITKYLRYGLKLTSVKNKKIMGEFEKRNEIYFQKYDDFIKNFNFSLANYIIDLIKLNKQAESNWEELEISKKKKLEIAIISILVDSYAHNISAHSLAALKWWIEIRYKILEKRFEIKGGSELNCLQPSSIIFNKEENQFNCNAPSTLKINNNIKTTLKYYEALGLKDKTAYNENYYSLFDFIQFADSEVVKNLFKFENVKYSTHSFNPRFPVPIDYALFPFFRFLRDKGAFWSGVTRDIAFGGETKTWYKMLWEDFANNPLYLGTIAKSEGITKININLDVNISGEHHKGRFVSIDMSVIDYEEKIFQDPNLNADNCIELLTQNNNLGDCDECNEHVEACDYSKYAFVKLGKCFAKFRTILDNEEYSRVFLPGGIVGEHALFTIFENTIRNIKHYKEPNILKDIQEKGIDFWISIEESKIKKTNSTKNQLFEVSVWLNHLTDLVSVGKNNEKKYLLFDITENTLKPILNEQTGAPRMGGNSQDKACAAMLFNNEFNSVESNGDDLNKGERNNRDREYFPWITFSTKSNGSEFKLTQKINTKKDDLESLKEKYEKHLSSNNKGILKKYFYLWRGEDVLDKSAIENEGWENPSRAKFLVNKRNWNSNEIIKARRLGSIRNIIDSENIINLNNLYIKWLNSWIENIENSKIEFYSGSEFELGLGINKGKMEFCKLKGDDNQIIKKLYLAHGGNVKSYNSCNVRSHGAFWSRFFNVPTLTTDPSKLSQYLPAYYNELSKEEKQKVNLQMLEMLEVVLSNVIIFDNRIFQRIPQTYNSRTDNMEVDSQLRSKTKNEMLREDLSLIIFDENENEFKFWLKEIIRTQKTGNINFLIMHLSFIENIKDDSNQKYSEERLEEFILDKFCDSNGNLIFGEHFIFVVTSGRGRDKWRESLRNKTSKFERFTIFKPVESLLSAVEQGIAYNDHFDIKYNLIKVLFGN